MIIAINYNVASTQKDGRSNTKKYFKTWQGKVHECDFTILKFYSHFTRAPQSEFNATLLNIVNMLLVTHTHIVQPLLARMPFSCVGFVHSRQREISFQKKNVSQRRNGRAKMEIRKPVLCRGAVHSFRFLIEMWSWLLVATVAKISTRHLLFSVASLWVTE